MYQSMSQSDVASTYPFVFMQAFDMGA